MTDTHDYDKRVLPDVLRKEWERLADIARTRARLARIDAEIARMPARQRTTEP